MKNLLVLIAIFPTTFIYSQTYYTSPKEKIEITLTIKEPYKPINYAEIGQNFNNMLNAELQRREALKRYYDDIKFQSVNSIYSNTVLTSDNSINGKLLNLQSIAIQQLEMLNRLLKQGILKPNEYESQLNKTYYEYMNANQIFHNISSYKQNKLNSLNDENLRNQLINRFNETMNSISEFYYNTNGSINFNLSGLMYDFNTVGQLYSFVTTSSEGSLDVYKAAWNTKNKMKEEELLKDIAKRYEETQKKEKYKLKIIEQRENYLKTLQPNEIITYKKTERNYLNKKLNKWLSKQEKQTYWDQESIKSLETEKYVSQLIFSKIDEFLKTKIEIQ